MECALKTDLDFEVQKLLTHWNFSEFDALIELHGSDLFRFAVGLCIFDLAPNPLDSFTHDDLITRLKHYYSDVPALQGLRLEHSLGL